jgi:hypothetical protein
MKRISVISVYVSLIFVCATTIFAAVSDIIGFSIPEQVHNMLLGGVLASSSIIILAVSYIGALYIKVILMLCRVGIDE